MDRLVRRRALAITWVGNIGPKMSVILEKSKDKARDYQAEPSANGLLEAKGVHGNN